MSQTICISVTQEDIKGGRPRRAAACPVALALQRELQCLFHLDKVKAWASEDSLCIIDSHIDAPLIVRNFVARFDEQKRVKPFSFELELPESLVVQLGK